MFFKISVNVKEYKEVLIINIEQILFYIINVL